MIISHKHKYIFIGLPFSASSAINKELIAQYDGEPLLAKHSNIPLVRKVFPDLELSDYYIFAVVRDPLDMCFSVYNKFVTNAYDVFTDPKYFVENGGHVDIRAREKYKVINEEGLNFQEFLQRYYANIPYDNFLSLNTNELNGIIFFDQLNTGFLQCLREIGLTPKRDLPIHNQTSKKIQNYTLESNFEQRLFFPFKYYNRKWFGQKIELKWFFNYLSFRIVNFYRHKKWITRDYKYYINRANKSMVD
ncbi:hypothetical protein [Algoriphagus halophytocola]|uniref:Sulfotransferase family protein n=1 Tax=Algoriphagus halophytocola TaxID=2991499 RepID=A0ABY6MJB4_9BACT|nr:hypothetical protein [Algoriphagus sp. TR-M5]UZD23865.1 hypothetical protein OM944_05075 [Algoriphagus sp. TR-M5]